MSTNHVILTPRGEFSLAQSIRFLGGFVPLSYGSDRDDPEQPLRLAFPTERDCDPSPSARTRPTPGG